MIYDKYRLVQEVLPPQTHSVLDVGCRDGVLRKSLNGNIKYTGVDIVQGELVSKVCNAEEGLPFGNNSFDAVVALDLLEHTDNIWYVFDELVRVARNQIVVVFPNMYHWKHRLSYLAGKEMGKYRLTQDPILDRHRWLTSYTSSRAFCEKMTQKHNLRMRELVLAGGRRTFLADIGLSFISKNLSAWAAMFIFEKKF
jgi:2-polyprenyl-3-methyl-5-hydroxy-6-metoxy-1,4-benzoquinol methylase